MFILLQEQFFGEVVSRHRGSWIVASQQLVVIWTITTVSFTTITVRCHTNSNTTMSHLSILCCCLLVAASHAFVTTRPNLQVKKSSLTKTTKALNVIPEAFTDTPETARTYFYIWFFGGQGGATVALGQFPKQFAKFKSLFDMSEEGPTAAGETVGLSPLCLYPRDISKADVDQVLSNKLSVEQMVAKGPKPNYLSEKGYLCFESFADANKKCNPLTIRAVFDAMSTGDNCDPSIAQTKLDEFRSDPSAFKNSLLKQKLAGFSSIAFLLFLLGPIVAETCLEAASFGWFPEWPGGNNLPWSLLIGPGFWTIPEYWI